MHIDNLACSVPFKKALGGESAKILQVCAVLRGKWRRRALHDRENGCWSIRREVQIKRKDESEIFCVFVWLFINNAIRAQDDHHSRQLPGNWRAVSAAFLYARILTVRGCFHTILFGTFGVL